MAARADTGLNLACMLQSKSDDTMQNEDMIETVQFEACAH